MELRESGEMYLETIMVLSGTNKKVRSIDIAEYMNFSKPSVSRAISILKDEDYINVDNKGYITLTSKGEEIASTIYERHIILSKFFEKIGVEASIADEDACRIEHVISKETFKKIKLLYYKMCEE